MNNTCNHPRCRAICMHGPVVRDMDYKIPSVLRHYRITIFFKPCDAAVICDIPNGIESLMTDEIVLWFSTR